MSDWLLGNTQVILTGSPNLLGAVTSLTRPFYSDVTPAWMSASPQRLRFIKGKSPVTGTILIFPTLGVSCPASSAHRSENLQVVAVY